MTFEDLKIFMLALLLGLPVCVLLLAMVLSVVVGIIDWRKP